MAATFTPETGSGLPNANQYSALAEVSAYHEECGNDGWAAMVVAKGATYANSCIVRATRYIDKRFSLKFLGYKMSSGQALAFPRMDAYDENDYQITGVPTRLKQATAEYALRAHIYMTLAPDPLRPTPAQDMSVNPPTQDTETETGQVKSHRIQVGPISESTSFESAQDILARNSAAGTREQQSSIMNDFNLPEYPEADLLIEPLLSTAVQGITLVRGG